MADIPRCCALLSLFALLSACSRQSEPAGHGANDGHGHGEAKAHTETKDGVVMCTEHNVPEAQCGICKPQLAGTLKIGESAKVRLASNESANIAGVRCGCMGSERISPAARSLTRGAGTQFDPALVARFEEMLRGAEVPA